MPSVYSGINFRFRKDSIMKIENTLQYAGEHLKVNAVRCLADDGTEMSHGGFNTIMTRFGGHYVPTLTVGGIGTNVLYRRQGCVREMLNEFLPHTKEYGVYVSLLHPFSFAFYRKFGYERVSDTVICDFPITALDFLPRRADVVPLTPERLPELLDLFDTFSKDRNVMFRRTDGGRFRPERTYLHCDASGKADAYIQLEGENHYDGINRMVSDNLHIYEMGYASREGLLGILSFVRMFEGEFDTVRIHDLGPIPEVDLILKHFMHTKYDVHPDIMARILDTEGMLKANTYPDEHGVFTLRVEDTLDTVKGTFRVEYENGSCSVERLSDSASADLTVGPQALAKLLYGVDQYDARYAVFMDGVTMHTPAQDFFRAFPKRICGLFEHF